MAKELVSETKVEAGTAEALPSREKVQETLSPQVRSLSDRDFDNARRRPIIGASRLGVDCSKLISQGLHPYWRNDDKGQVEDALANGYRFVKLSEIESNPVMGAPSADGDQRVSRRVGVKEDGTALMAYLMVIRKEWHEENTAYYQQRCDAIDRQIRSGSVSSVESSYAPKDGISYTSRNR